jgi:hypothetical protein
MSNQTTAASVNSSSSIQITEDTTMTTQTTTATNFDYGMPSVNSIARAYNEQSHGPLTKSPLAIGEVCEGNIYQILASSGKSLFDKPAQSGNKDKDAFQRLINKAQERWELATAMKTKVGYLPAANWQPTNRLEVTSMTNFAPLTIDLSGLNLTRSVLDFTVVLNQKGNPNNASQKLIGQARALYVAAPVRAGLAVSFAGIPVPTQVPVFDYGAIDTDRINRKWSRTVRRAMNRSLFTLTNVLGLVSRRYAKVTRQTPQGFGVPTTASVTGTKTMNNSRRINQNIARTARVKRQRRNSSRKQTALTTQQRAANRAARAAKLVAKQERRALAKAALAAKERFLAAQRLAGVMALGVTPKGQKAPATQRFVKGSTAPAPVTKQMKSAALRGAHDGVKYVNGVEVPVAAKVVKAQRNIARKDREALSPAIRNRRFAAENTTKFQRSCRFAAGRALSQGQSMFGYEGRLLSNWEVNKDEDIKQDLTAVTAAVNASTDILDPQFFDYDRYTLEGFFEFVLRHDVDIDHAVEVACEEYSNEQVAQLVESGHWISSYVEINYVGAAPEIDEPVTVADFEERAKAIMANAKEKYGAGDMTMCMTTKVASVNQAIEAGNYLGNLVEHYPTGSRNDTYSIFVDMYTPEEHQVLVDALHQADKVATRKRYPNVGQDYIDSLPVNELMVNYKQEELPADFAVTKESQRWCSPSSQVVTYATQQTKYDTLVTVTEKYDIKRVVIHYRNKNMLVAEFANYYAGTAGVSYEEAKLHAWSLMASLHMSAAKEQYGAGDLQMSLNSTPEQHSASKKAEEAPQQGNLEANSSSLNKEDSMINQIQNCFGDSLTKAVSVGNTLHTEETLGYAFGFALIYVNAEGNVYHGNINLPIRNNYSLNQWAKYGAPLKNENETLNFSSLVDLSKTYPIISVRSANAQAAQRQSLVFMSKDWNRPSMLVSRAAPEVQPNLWFPGADGVVKPSHFVPGEKVDERISGELLDTRKKCHAAILKNRDYSDEFSNVVAPAAGLNLKVGRNIVFFIADVSHYMGLTKNKELLFDVRKQNGTVVGAEKLISGAFTSKEGAFFGKNVAFTRVISNSVNFYTINDFGGVSSQPDWDNEVPSKVKKLIFPIKVTKALTGAFFAGNDLIKEELNTFAPFAQNSFYHKKYTEEHYQLMNMLDMRPVDAIAYTENTKSFGKFSTTVDKTVVLKKEVARAVTPIEPVVIAEPVGDIGKAPTVALGESTVEARTITAVAEPEVVAEIGKAVVVEIGEPVVEARPVTAVEVVKPVIALGSYAQELAAYNKAVTTRWITADFAEVDVDSFKQGKIWANAAHIMAFGDKNAIVAVDAKHLACFAVQRYLTAVTDSKEFSVVDFSGRAWSVEHVEAIIEILHSYSPTADSRKKLASWYTDGAGNKVLSLYGQEYSFIDGLGVVDSRGRLFKNLLEVSYTINDKKKRVFDTTACINSVGNFLRLIYFGFLPMFSTGKLEEVERIGSNLNQLMNTCPDLFPVTSDEIMGDNAMVLWAESNAWTPIGCNSAKSYAPFRYMQSAKKYAFVNCAGAMAKSLSLHYTQALKDVHMTGGDMAEEWVTHSLDNWSMVSSFNKGCAFGATGFFTDIHVLAKHAPTIYGHLKAEINRQCLALGGSLETIAGIMKMSVDDLLATMVVNNNQKASKGTKRILLRACNTIQSGNVVDFTNKPQLRALLEAGHGSKPRDTKWASRVHPDFYMVKTGSKLLYQTGHAEGTLLRVALMLTGVAPAGEAIFIGDPSKAPHGFNDKVGQATAVLANRCVAKEEGPVNVLAGHVKQTVVPPIDVDFPGCIFNGIDYTVKEEVIRGTKYVYYVPTGAPIAMGNGVTTICGVKTDDSFNPIKPVQHERRNGDGVLEWVRYHVAPSLTTSHELELEWKVTWRESDAKIRSVIAKAQLLYTKESFLIHGLNKLASTSLVDVVYPNDVVKADTMVSMVGTIGATLVYNPDCVHPTFVAMRELAMDINEEVEGRRHLDYLIEDSTAVAANPKYRKLFGMFFNHFKTTLWSNWQQLESGDFGPAMLRLYEDYVALGKWIELDQSELGFLAAAGFATKEGKLLGNYRVFVDNKDVANENTNVFVFSFKNGVVSSIKQRCLSLMGKGNCPIYDVVMYERSTNKEACGVNPSGQMDVNVRSLQRIANAAGQNAAGFAETLMQRQAETGKQVSMMQAKFLTLMLARGLSSAMPAAKVLKLGEWKYNEAKKESVFVHDAVAVETVRQRLQNVNFKDPNHFGEICTLLQDYIIEIESSRTETVAHDLGEGNFETETYRPACQVWTPFLYNLNGLNSENNSHNTLSGFFREFLLNVIDGKQPTLVSSQMLGMLESFATSESIRKFISGDAAVNGKVLSLPCCPTQVYLITEHGDQWKTTQQALIGTSHDLRKVPTWEQYLEHGEAVWDILDCEEIFVGHGRNPLADGANQRIVKLPASGKSLNHFFYSPTNLYKEEYEDNAVVGKPQLAKPYPYFQMVSVVAHTGMNKGDNDGDPTFIVVYLYKTPEEKQALRAMLTTFDFAWKYCEDSVGGKGMMAKRGAYLGDHLAAPKASKKTAVYFQNSWLALSVENNELVTAALLESTVFNRNNFRALIMQNTFVGVAYRVYRIGEAVVDLVRGLAKANFDTATLPACLQWCLADDAAEVVKAVTELYEIILGATDDDGWVLWKGYYEVASQGKFMPLSDVVAFSAPVTNAALAAVTKQADPVANHRSTSANLAEVMQDMGANDKYADRVAYCLWFTSLIVGATKGGKAIQLTAETGPKRNFEIILMAAVMSVEAGRGKWGGFNAGTLNATFESKDKAARHKDITRLVGTVINKPGLEEFFATWAAHSHTMLTLTQMTDSTVLGDLVTGRLVVGENKVINDTYVLTDDTLDFYRARLAKRVGDIVIPEVVINTVAEEDLNLTPPVFDADIVYQMEDDDLSYLDSYEDDGYRGPSEDDFSGSGLNNTPPDLGDDGSAATECDLNLEPPTDLDSGYDSEAELAELNNQPPTNEEETMQSNELPPDVPQDPSVYDVPEEDLIEENLTPPSAEEYNEALAALNGVEEPTIKRLDIQVLQDSEGFTTAISLTDGTSFKLDNGSCYGEQLVFVSIDAKAIFVADQSKYDRLDVPEDYQRYVGKIDITYVRNPKAPADYKEFLTVAQQGDLTIYKDNGVVVKYELGGESYKSPTYIGQDCAFFEYPDALFIFTGHEHTQNVAECFEPSIDNEDTLEDIFPIYIGQSKEIDISPVAPAPVVEEAVAIPTTVTPVVMELDEEPAENLTPPSDEDYAEALAALNDVEPAPAVATAPVAVITTPVVEPKQEVAPAPVTKQDLLAAILAETKAVKDELAKAKAALAKQEAEDKAIADAQAELAKVKAELEAVKGKLRPQYLAEVYGARQVTPVVEEPKQDKPEDKDGGAPVVTKKPDPKPPTAPAAKTEPKVAKQEAPTAKREVAPSAPVQEVKPQVTEQKVAPAPAKRPINTTSATTILHVEASAKDGRGGWAVRSEDGSISLSGHACLEVKATCQMMGVKAALEAMKAAANISGKVRLECPNTYVLTGILSGPAKQKANQGLWKQLDAVYQGIKGKVSIMKGSCDVTKALAAKACEPCEKCSAKPEIVKEESISTDSEDLKSFYVVIDSDKWADAQRWKSFSIDVSDETVVDGNVTDYQDKIVQLINKQCTPVVVQLDLDSMQWGHRVMINTCYVIKSWTAEEYTQMLKQEVPAAKREITPIEPPTPIDATAAGLRKAVLATNDLHLDTLGWSLAEAQTQLKALHGVTSRKELNNAQLVDWAQYCECLVEEQAELVKKQNNKEETTKDTNMTVTNEASAKKLQGQKRPIPISNIESSTVEPITVTTTSRSSVDRSVVALPVSAQSTPCQTKFFNVACSGVDIFLSGAPGTGKTYATEQIARHWLSLGDKVIITATTGRAVMNLGSMFEDDELAGLGTLNSVLKLGIAFDEEDRWSSGASDWSWANTLVAKGSKDTQLASLLKGKNGCGVRFIIDEVSMLDARLLWVVINILRAHNPAIQILLVGDGNQLQPVSPKEPASPFWKAPAFQGCNAPVKAPIDEFTVVNLVTNVRQADDVALKEALDHLANTNELSGVLLERLEGCLTGSLKPPADVDCTHIRYNNLTVKNINDDHTAALQAEKRIYRAVISDNTRSGQAFPSWINEFSPISAVMELGVGMPVKLRKNRKEKGTLEASNGSRGIITKLEDEAVWVKFENGKVLKVVPHVFEGAKDRKGNSKGTFVQLPLHPDYATTGHSCQGLTITNAVVIGIYRENRVFSKGRPVLREDGTVKTYKLAIQDAEWLLVACSRVQRAEQIFFDVEDPNTLNLVVGSMGNKDRSYFEWLEGKALK